MNLWQLIRRGSTAQRFDLPREFNPLDFLYAGTRGGPVNGQYEVSGASLSEISQRIYKTSGPIWSLIAVRMMLFGEARYRFQRMRDGVPGDLFSTADLQILDHPDGVDRRGVNGLRRLAMRAEQDASLMGNGYLFRPDTTLPEREGMRDRVRRLRPDWVTLIYGSDSDHDYYGDALDGELIAYAYTPRMPNATTDKTEGPVTILYPHEVSHYAPYPDPEGYHRGMSWLTPVIREITADNWALDHKESFFRNGATTRLAVKVDPSIEKEDFEKLVAMIESHHTGPFNAYKTLYLGGGADPVPMTMNMKDLDYKAITGAGETRLAAAAGIHPVIVGFSEGLEGSALNAGNYQQVKRRVGDGTLRPLWGAFAESLEAIIPTPNDARIWYDEAGIAFIRDDSNDAAEILNKRATTIRTLTDAGFEPTTAIKAAQSGDLSQLKHTGLFSVQLQPPGAGEMPADESGNTDPQPKPTDTTGTEGPATPEDGTQA